MIWMFRVLNWMEVNAANTMAVVDLEAAIGAAGAIPVAEPNGTSDVYQVQVTWDGLTKTEMREVFARFGFYVEDVEEG